MPQQVLEQGELARAEVDGAAPEAHGAPPLVQLELAHAEHLVGLQRRAPQERAGAGEQLREGEGLGEVVVGAGVQAGHLVVDLVAGGEQQDRGGRPRGAHAAQHLEAVHAGQHDVQDDGVELGVQGALQPSPAVGLHRHHEAGFAQALTDEAGDAAFVFHDEHAHGGPFAGERIAVSGSPGGDATR